MKRGNVQPSFSFGNHLMFFMVLLITIGFVAQLLMWIFLLRQSITAEMLGFGLYAFIGWGIYWSYRIGNTMHHFTNHLTAFYTLFLFVSAIVYNPLKFEDLWISFLLYPIAISLLLDKKVFCVWTPFACFFYIWFSIVKMPIYQSEITLLSMVNRILFLSGTLFLGWIIVTRFTEVKEKFGLKTSMERVEEIFRILHTLVPVVERKTSLSRKEIDRTSFLMKRILSHFPNERIQDWEIQLTSLLHFVSRIKLPDYIFEKKEKLTECEYRAVQEHCVFAVDFLDDDPIYRRVRDALLYHHERMDGKGYPFHLKDHPIPILAQVLYVVESFIAMTTPRSYRKALTQEEALLEMESTIGTAVESKVVEALRKEIGLTKPVQVFQSIS